MFIPSIIETVGRSQKAFDLPTKLLQDRIIYLGGEITQQVSDIIIIQMLWLNSDNSDKPIDLYINSIGGDVYSGLAIKDIMNSVDCKVNTVGLGMCASMGAYLLAAGTGTRKATQNCRIMIHSVSSGMKGTFQDLEVNYKETQYLQDKMLNDFSIFSKGKCIKQTFEALVERDFFMSPNEAIDYGLIDEVIT